MERIQLDCIDNYIDEFNCSEHYRKECYNLLRPLFSEEDVYTINIEAQEWVRTGEKTHVAFPNSLADSLNSFNEQLQDILDNLLERADDLNLFNEDSLYSYEKFSKPEPQRPNIQVSPDEPDENSAKYFPKEKKVSFIKKIVNVNAEEEAREQAKKEAHQSFLKDHEEWKETVNRIKAFNKEYEKWLSEKQAFEDEINKSNQQVSEMLAGIEKKDPYSIARLYERIIESSILPFDFDLFASAHYEGENRRLIIDVDIPTITDLPKVKSVKYIKSRDIIEFKYQTDSYMKKLYDKIIYQVVLLLIHHCFEYEKTADLLDAMVLNGYVSTVDPASGKWIRPCILSVSTDRNAYNDLVLSSVDAKAWFKSVKGVAAAKIELSTPVPPIITMNKDDRRFVESYDVANQLDNSTNLASMDWKDFENLVRELFEKEFSINGGEVKVTQASRDGGVDAVAFDPDPIRGGKIVIQAKRYTNVVGVSAVRDLYGTVMNEGANKGILVTTSGYGNDAYEFAKDKPITLLDGGNLLSLLEKHGHKVRIDIREAKELL